VGSDHHGSHARRANSGNKAETRSGYSTLLMGGVLIIVWGGLVPRCMLPNDHALVLVFPLFSEGVVAYLLNDNPWKGEAIMVTVKFTFDLSHLTFIYLIHAELNIKLAVTQPRGAHDSWASGSRKKGHGTRQEK
jgi:hypothetical protein